MRAPLRLRGQSPLWLHSLLLRHSLPHRQRLSPLQPFCSLTVCSQTRGMENQPRSLDMSTWRTSAGDKLEPKPLTYRPQCVRRIIPSVAEDWHQTQPADSVLSNLKPCLNKMCFLRRQSSEETLKKHLSIKCLTHPTKHKSDLWY